MKRGCLGNLLFVIILVVAFGGSTYFWFNFFIRGKSLPTPNLIGRSVIDAKAICSDLGVALNVDTTTRRNSGNGCTIKGTPAPGYSQSLFGVAIQ